MKQGISRESLLYGLIIRKDGSWKTSTEGRKRIGFVSCGSKTALEKLTESARKQNLKIIDILAQQMS